MTRFSDNDLKHAFTEFNTKYFRFGKKKMSHLLSVEWHRFEGSESGVMGDMNQVVPSPLCDGWVSAYKIRINREYKDRREWRTWMLTLLHEMAHFKLAGIDPGKDLCNSRMFNREMKRLANAGALNGLW
ncbi:MAG TPA: hypothetical protein VJ476_05960 [Rhizomicrobium sp.]|nr:hypothetical protein [Rhizomicrobium sp.]